MNGRRLLLPAVATSVAALLAGLVRRRRDTSDGGRNGRAALEALAARQTARLETLTRLTRTITASLDPDVIVRAVAAAAVSLFPGAVCRLWLAEGDVLRVRAEAGVSGGNGTEREVLRRGQGLAGAVCETGRPVVLEDVYAHPGLDDVAWLRAEGAVAVAALPLAAAPRVIGTLAVFSRARRVWTPEEVGLLGALAEQAAVSLEKARLFQDTQERRRLSERLYALAVAMERSPDLATRLQEFVTGAREALSFDRCNVMLAAPDGGALDLVAGTDHDPARTRVPLADAGGCRVVWESGQTLIVGSDAQLAALPPLSPELADHPVLRTRRFAIVPLTFRGQPLGLVAVDNKRTRRPITLRGVAQLQLFCQQLAQSISSARLYEEAENRKTQLEQVFASTSDGFLVTDLHGRVVALNRQAGDFLGLVPGEMVGRPYHELFDRAAVKWDGPGGQALAAALAGAADTGSADLEVRTLVPRTLRWQAAPTRDLLGAPVGVTVTLRDVTREREIDRMKTDFVSTVSHELRTPLTSIKGSLHLLLTDTTLIVDGVQRQLLEISLKNTDRLVRLINNMLDVSRIEAGQIRLELALHHVSDFVSAAAEGIGAFADARGIAIDVAVPAGLPPVTVDVDRMVQVVTNLLSNAVKFSPAGTRVTVSAKLEADEMAISVADQGQGIASQDLSRLFQKFQQLDRRGSRGVGGTGLGLAICRGILEEHGGRITVESDLGVGSTFTVFLPRPGREMTV
ncbi:MAG TPA: ATP-binding protein [Candidatus Limnocylindrales bacterium]|nr:ATP-binding protein [Candidatus Limnocylindrales bacterium]